MENDIPTEQEKTAATVRVKPMRRSHEDWKAKYFTMRGYAAILLITTVLMGIGFFFGAR